MIGFQFIESKPEHTPWDRAVSLLLLTLSLSLVALLDAFVMSTLNMSQFAVCFVHGILVSLYAFENWVLLRDLRAKTAPVIVLVDRIKTQAEIIQQLIAEKQTMQSVHLKFKKRTRDWRSCNSFFSDKDARHDPPQTATRTRLLEPISAGQRHNIAPAHGD
jgi:hypothetical protein